MTIALIVWALTALALLVLIVRAAPATIRTHREDVRHRRARQFLLARLSWPVDTFTANLITANEAREHLGMPAHPDFAAAGRAVATIADALGDLPSKAVSS